MIQDKKLIVVMPAYNAEKTLRRTFGELPHEYVDEVILVDDASRDNTAKMARTLGINTLVHAENRGYGANQKTCYKEALRYGADIVVMIHPDYQYSPKLVTAMASMVASGHYDVVLGRGSSQGSPSRGECRSTNTWRTGSSPWLKISCWGSSCPNSIPDSALSEQMCLRRSPSRGTLTISSSITRCLFSPYISGSGSERSVARRDIFRRLPPSTSPEASCMESGSCRRP